MDYSAQNQGQQAAAAAAAAAQPAQPAAAVPAQPATPAAPAATTPNAQDDLTVVLDDLFPEAKPADAAAAPAAPAKPDTAAAPAAGDDAAKQAAELQAKFQESEQKLHSTINNSVEQINAKIDRNNELVTFFQNADNTPFRKYQNEITKTATDPRFIGMKLDRVIGLTLGPKVMMKLGAEMGGAAVAAANGNRTGGNQNTARVVQNAGGPNYATMTDAEFAARRDAVIRGERPSN